MSFLRYGNREKLLFVLDFFLCSSRFSCVEINEFKGNVFDK
jgi:hypothetical protein